MLFAITQIQFAHVFWSPATAGTTEPKKLHPRPESAANRRRTEEAYVPTCTSAPKNAQICRKAPPAGQTRLFIVLFFEIAGVSPPSDTIVGERTPHSIRRTHSAAAPNRVRAPDGIRAPHSVKARGRIAAPASRSSPTLRSSPKLHWNPKQHWTPRRHWNPRQRWMRTPSSLWLPPCRT